MSAANRLQYKMEVIARGKNGIDYLYDRIHTYEEHFDYLQGTKGIHLAADYAELKAKFNDLKRMYNKLGNNFEKLLEDYNNIKE